MYNIDLRQHFKTVHLIVDMQTIWAEQLSAEDRAAISPAIEGFIRDTYETIPPIYVLTRSDEMYASDDDAILYDSSVKQVFNPAVTGSLGRAYKETSRLSCGSSVFPFGKNSELHGRLQEMGTEELIISGGFTRRCVWETAADAANLGYKVTIMDDLCREPPGFKNSQHYPEVTKELCAAHGITLANSAQCKNKAGLTL